MAYWFGAPVAGTPPKTTDPAVDPVDSSHRRNPSEPPADSCAVGSGGNSGLFRPLREVTAPTDPHHGVAPMVRDPMLEWSFADLRRAAERAPVAAEGRHPDTPHRGTGVRPQRRARPPQPMASHRRPDGDAAHSDPEPAHSQSPASSHREERSHEHGGQDDAPGEGAEGGRHARERGPGSPLWREAEPAAPQRQPDGDEPLGDEAPHRRRRAFPDFAPPPGHQGGLGEGDSRFERDPWWRHPSGATDPSRNAGAAPRGEASAAPAGGPPDSRDALRFLPPETPQPPPRQPAGQRPHTGGASLPPPVPPRPSVDVTQGQHRLHGATMAFRAVIVALVFLAMPGLALVPLGLGWVILLTLMVGVGAAAFGVVWWWHFTFQLHGDHLILHSGVMRQTSREIPLSRLQAVDVVRPLLAQMMGLAEVRLELAGGDRGEIRLRLLSRAVAEQLRASVLAHAAGLSGVTPEAPEQRFYRLPFGLLLGALAFRIPVQLALLAFLLLVAAGTAFMEFGVLGGAVPLLLGLLRGFLGPLLRYTGFFASLSPDGLRLRYGAFQARMQTVPPGRVQAVRIVQPLLWRLLGVVRVEANVAGYVGERQMDSSTLLPVVPRHLAFALVRELFPGTDAENVPRRGHQRAGLPWRHEALGMDDHLVVTEHGLVCRVISIVPYARVQAVRMTAGPWARRSGSATVEAATPPGPVRARAVWRGLVDARHVLDTIVRRGHRARSTTAGPERWATRSDTSGDGTAGRP
ncbi:PH domain-containing protein [Salinactinospora qingdaonensis]|uniref:YdbS-like PH domain-containing protein n=1 Tax=Salinactinospora qingdaonensis TaxID=702744 RepID=A0ABP7GB24_9ACTN